MDSLVFLCARRVVAQHPLPNIPASLYPVLFQAAFLDGRPLVLQDLVATWPFPVLHVQQLVGHLDLRRDDPTINCDEAIIQSVVAQLQRELEEPGSDSSRSQLRVLDMTGLTDFLSDCTPDGWTSWSRTESLAMACVEVSRLQQEFQRQGIKQHKGCSGVMMAKDASQPPGVDVHADLVVESNSYAILCDALQTRAAGPLRLKCHEFQTRYISESEIVPLLDSLDPSCLRRVDLNLKYLVELLVILPHLLRFPALRSLKLRYRKWDVQPPTSESAIRIRAVARQLGMLPCLRELNLRSARLSGNLRLFLCGLQAPLESLELQSCSLIPADLTFLTQTFHAPALKRLKLSGLNVSQALLEPLQLLLEKASASLLYLDLSDCDVADSHLAVLLPTLLRCSHLSILRLDGNFLSTAALKDLLQKTLELPNLRQVFYPIPVDCCRLHPLDFGGNFFPDEERLAAAKAEFSQILANYGRTDLVWTPDPKAHKAMDYFL